MEVVALEIVLGDMVALAVVELVDMETVLEVPGDKPLMAMQVEQVELSLIHI